MTRPSVSAGRAPVVSRNTSKASRLPIIAARGPAGVSGAGTADRDTRQISAAAPARASLAVSRSMAQYQQPRRSVPAAGPTTARRPNVQAGSRVLPSGIPAARRRCVSRAAPPIRRPRARCRRRPGPPRWARLAGRQSSTRGRHARGVQLCRLGGGRSVVVTGDGYPGHPVADQAQCARVRDRSVADDHRGAVAERGEAVRCAVGVVVDVADLRGELLGHLRAEDGRGIGLVGGDVTGETAGQQCADQFADHAPLRVGQFRAQFGHRAGSVEERHQQRGQPVGARRGDLEAAGGVVEQHAVVGRGEQDVAPDPWSGAGNRFERSAQWRLRFRRQTGWRRRPRWIAGRRAVVLAQARA